MRVRTHDEIATSICSTCGNDWRWRMGNTQRPGGVCDECWSAVIKQRLIDAGGTGEGRGRKALDIDSERDTILNFLQKANELVGKKEILKATEVDSNKYIKVIKDLLEEEVIVQEGRKRGAKYRLATAE